MPTTEPWVVLAHILRPQGRKGEVLAELLTDFPERFDQHKDVWLAPREFAGPATEARPVQIVGFWLPVGRNAGRVVLHFAGIDRIEDAAPLAGKQVIVPLAQRVPLDEGDPGAAYISDLAGCTVYDGEIAIGTVEDVQFATSPDGLRRLEEAAPLLVVRSTDGDEVLVPFVKAFLVEIDLPAKRIRMALPVGLLQVNR